MKKRSKKGLENHAKEKGFSVKYAQTEKGEQQVVLEREKSPLEAAKRKTPRTPADKLTESVDKLVQQNQELMRQVAENNQPPVITDQIPRPKKFRCDITRDSNNFTESIIITEIFN